MATPAKKAPAKKVNKSAKVVAMLKRPNGVTRDQVLKATGWKAISMQQVARNVDLKLKVDESKRPFVYRA